ncbi:hypothetical protein RM780_09520 [Streptomyces sp. DSM 44917]|uniref:Uncharacterized protein n=1 Tax=Streptomyces boetiae TaxID=3075541 RepID=A0ABU2L6Q2_9ACTN|nr:hypothetical protein [Streptomyces sp. DSM 44917]MDT0307200.1 hypothetical protein [Streptomyces sp. DSM 44917]
MSLSPEAAEFLAAVGEVMDLPFPAGVEGWAARDALLRRRANLVKAAIDAALGPAPGCEGLGLAEQAEILRETAARHFPLTYASRPPAQPEGGDRP